MKLIATFASLALFASSVFSYEQTINTPSDVYSCFDTLVTWSGGISPHTLSVTPPYNVDEVYDVYTGLTGDSYEWGVNIAPNTEVQLVLRDSNGQEAQTEPFTVTAKPGTAPPGCEFAAPTPVDY